MAIGSQESVPLISLLRIIFSQGKLTVSLAGLTDLERSRNIAFYGANRSTGCRNVH